MQWETINTGQIRLHQGLGLCIQKYAADSRFTRYLEIGTWNGRGSTVCFAAGFQKRQDTVILQSLEIQSERMQEASTLWASIPSIRILYGRILPDNKTPSFEVISKIHSDIRQDWHVEDLEHFKNSPYINISSFNPEVVLLDGGEYITYFEYLEVKDTAQVLMLDDTAVAKCKRIVDELNTDPAWTCVAESFTERNGWHVFERVSPSN
jgi:hypothetical protein